MTNIRIGSPRRALTTLDFLLKALHGLLIVVTAVAVPMMVLALTGRGSITVNGTLESPYSVGLEDGRRVSVSETIVSYENFEIGSEHDVFSGLPTVQASIRVAPDDLDSRGIVIGLASIWLGSAWVGLISFRRIVRSAVDGEPFAQENSRRLRWLGAAVVVAAGSGLVAQWLLDRTLDSGVPFHVSLSISGSLIMALVGVATLALAEPFAEATRLRDLDAATI